MTEGRCWSYTLRKCKHNLCTLYRPISSFGDSLQNDSPYAIEPL